MSNAGCMPVAYLAFFFGFSSSLSNSFLKFSSFCPALETVVLAEPKMPNSLKKSRTFPMKSTSEDIRRIRQIKVGVETAL